MQINPLEPVNRPSTVGAQRNGILCPIFAATKIHPIPSVYLCQTICHDTVRNSYKISNNLYYRVIDYCFSALVEYRVVDKSFSFSGFVYNIKIKINRGRGYIVETSIYFMLHICLWPPSQTTKNRLNLNKLGSELTPGTKYKHSVHG
jgi:hypothetical protein